MNILLVHPCLKRGGSEARLLWSVEALKEAHQLTIATSGGANLDELNATYGTDIDSSEVNVVETGLPWWIVWLKAGDALKVAWFNRQLHRISPGFDLVLSTYHPVDVQIPAIQFIADFSWDDEERRRLHPEQGWRGFVHGDNMLRRIYLGFAQWLSQSLSFTETLRKSACIVSNSQFSAAILRNKYGISSRVIYPPVAGAFPAVPWNHKKNRFIVLGRIVPEKELEKVISIVGQVRDKGHEMELLVLGDWENSGYGKSLQQRAEARGGWVCFAGDCRGEKKARLLAESKFAIHGCEGEAFGIAVAEMMKAGCISFVPAEGGPAEIVNDARMLYSSAADAINKIDLVLRNEGLQRELVAHVEAQGKQYSEQAFMASIRNIVLEYNRDQ